ncbi:class I SAM-dependent methyltransferase [Amycolatopsis suaedae]|uniref:Class I SAM-dependent methyltransferase n=1 Tax=Amycolatopsis suaedae TaxID=2510978 RepID=A0A4Q7J6J6_9PSEU|nr:class I SAM-dependent methyltransferase [Amycolatopsis suaedae]RZQ61624.1 class I SAM-dependent methyltransferase [Amycolatopsis suaedae]
MSDAFFALHDGLPRQAPGSDATTRRLLELAGPLPERPRVLDLGCGPGRSALLLAEAGCEVTAVDLHQPFLDELIERARRRGLAVTAVKASMADLPYADGSFDLLWAESSVYILGFDNALRQWRRLLAPGGTLVVTECEWTTPEPAPEARAFWDQHYPLRTPEANAAAARKAGYEVAAVLPMPDSDWFDEYYGPLEQRLETADPALAEAVAASRVEIDMRRRHGDDYRYAGYVLRPV